MADDAKVDKIRKLLELARSAGDTPEGRVARAKAEARLREGGLDEEGVLSDRVVATEGRVQIWEQALMEVCADLHGCGLEVDRKTRTWTLKGSRKASRSALRRFEHLRSCVRREAQAYVDLVRRRMSMLGDEASFARHVLERMRRVFSESASLALVIRALEQILGEEAAEAVARAANESEEEVDLNEEPSRRKRPFEKLTDRCEVGGEVDWDLEIDVPDDTPDPSTAGYQAGQQICLEAPLEAEIELSPRRLTG